MDASSGASCARLKAIRATGVNGNPVVARTTSSKPANMNGVARIQRTILLRLPHFFDV
jgi:hypothetical protein